MSRTIRRPTKDPVRLNVLTRVEDGTFPWSEFVRAMCSSDQFRTTVNVFDGYALRELLESVKPGESVDIPDAVWGVFCEIIKKPAIFSTHVCHSPECLAMFRGITEAPVSEKK